MGLSVFASALPPGRRFYERGEWTFVSRYLRPGMTVFDIGANQGLYTLLAARRVGSSGRVFAFEPAPSEFRRLARNLALNGFSNVVTVPSAVGSHEGKTTLYVCLDGRGDYSACRPPHDVKGARCSRTTVPITSLDTFIQQNEISAADFVKVDVEGGELEVLKGAALVLTKLRPVFMCELADIRTHQWGYDASEIYRYLSQYGYLLLRPNPDGSLTAAEARTKYEPEWENLLGVPEERAALEEATGHFANLSASGSTAAKH